MIRAVALDRDSEIVVQPRTVRSRRCSVHDQQPNAQVTALLYNFPESYQREQSQRASAPGAPILHQAGHVMSDRGTGGGTRSSTVRISPSNFCDNTVLQVTLAHELVHGLRQITGQQVGRTMPVWDNLEEFVACNVENVMRSELGLPLRVNHGKMAVDPVMLRFCVARTGRQTSRTQARPGGGFQMRDPDNEVQVGEVERFMESIRRDRSALASLAREFAAEYLSLLRDLRNANRRLVEALIGVTAALFNPFIHI